MRAANPGLMTAPRDESSVGDDRWIRIAQTMVEADADGLLRLLLQQNELVSRDRGGSVGWARLGGDGKVDVQQVDPNRPLTATTTRPGCGSTATSSTSSERSRSPSGGAGVSLPREVGPRRGSAVGDRRAHSRRRWSSRHTTWTRRSSRGRCCPVFLGDDLKHTRRTREIQLDYEIRERDVLIDVYYEGRALAAHEGGGRLGWNRIRGPSRRGGVFHPKVVLALCETTTGRSRSSSHVSSANLTARRVVDQRRVRRRRPSSIDGQRHGYIAVLGPAGRPAGPAAPLDRRPATTKVRQFLQRQRGYTQATDAGVLRPNCASRASKTLPRPCEGCSASRLDGAHLEVVSPFIDADPLAGHERPPADARPLAPKTVRVVLPVRQDADADVRGGLSTRSPRQASSGPSCRRLPPRPRVASRPPSAGCTPRSTTGGGLARTRSTCGCSGRTTSPLRPTTAT